MTHWRSRPGWNFYRLERWVFFSQDLICKEWPNAQRTMASLSQKDVTQGTVVRMLSSYGRQNQTKTALWELDNLCRTLYILTFIDDVGMRQSVTESSQSR